MREPERSVKMLQTGTLKLNEKTKKLDTVSEELLPANFRGQSTLVPQSDRLPNVKGQQFISNDGNHILISEKIYQDTVFENYKWDFYESSTHNKVGTLYDYRSYSPFYISGNILVYQVGPY